MKRKLGEILVASGAVSQSDLDSALGEQQAGDPARVGELLVAMGYIDGQQLARALSVHYAIPFVELPAIPPPVLELVPVAFQRAHRMVPFRLDGERLSVAVAEPADQEGIKALKAEVGARRVVVFVASGDDIDAIHATMGDDVDMSLDSTSSKLDELFGDLNLEPSLTASNEMDPLLETSPVDEFVRTSQSLPQSLAVTTPGTMLDSVDVQVVEFSNEPSFDGPAEGGEADAPVVGGVQLEAPPAASDDWFSAPTGESFESARQPRSPATEPTDVEALFAPPPEPGASHGDLVEELPAIGGEDLFAPAPAALSAEAGEELFGQPTLGEFGDEATEAHAAVESPYEELFEGAPEVSPAPDAFFGDAPGVEGGQLIASNGLSASASAVAAPPSADDFFSAVPPASDEEWSTSAPGAAPLADHELFAPPPGADAPRASRAPSGLQQYPSGVGTVVLDQHLDGPAAEVAPTPEYEPEPVYEEEAVIEEPVALEEPPAVDPGWSGKLDDVPPSKLIVALTKALLRQGVVLEEELLEALRKK